ncbi:hypothetical protein PflCFBP13510_19165 [Pseudomonas fluorescens]|nr:hypothetical protein PflCFBP13510_19165 [Pseudomonas fluorescens]
MSITARVALLKVAENQMRSRGYSAFSYADLAAKVGIRKASIHHRFPTKECLGQALIKHSINRFQSTLRLIEDADWDPLVRLRAVLLPVQQFNQMYLESTGEDESFSGQVCGLDGCN